MNDWHTREITFLGLTCLWVRFLAKKGCKIFKKKTACTGQPEELWPFLWYCQMLSSSPVLPAKTFLKFILHSNENGNGMKFQFRFAWNTRPSPASRPTDQRRSAGTTFSGSESDDWYGGFFSWRGLTQQRALGVHSFSNGVGCRTRRFGSFRFQKAFSSWELAHVPRKNVLVWSATLHVVELLVLLYSRIHLEFCQIRKRFCLLAHFPWHVLYLHYVR